jgi:hypothetical protein
MHRLYVEPVAYCKLQKIIKKNSVDHMTAILMCLQEMPPVDKNTGTKLPLRTILQPFRARINGSFHNAAAYAGTTRSSILVCANLTPSFASIDDAVSIQHSDARAALPRSFTCTGLPDLFTSATNIAFSMRAA